MGRDLHPSITSALIPVLERFDIENVYPDKML
jgi:hypothetical protein